MEGLIRNAVLFVVFCVASAAAWKALVRTSPIDPVPVQLPSRPKREGIYAPNDRLQKAEKLGLGLLPNPEDLALDKHKRLYTACSDGWIKRILLDQAGLRVENWTYVGGRPLGLAFGPNEELIVCDPFQGLLNVTEGKVEVLSTEVYGLKLKIVDGLDVTKEGVVYFTDASDKFQPEDFLLDCFEYRPHGRLLKYDPTTKTTTVLVTDIYFANGVALSSQQDFLIFCETLLFRCRKYWLKGENKGSVESFIENLPGFPDNIRYDGKGTFWIGIPGTRGVFWDLFAKHTSLRHVLFWLSKFIDVERFLFKNAGILGVSENGEVIAFYSDPMRHMVTGGFKIDDHLYFVSTHENSISRL
eukprot:Gb_02716 [translate_table: standard]